MALTLAQAAAASTNQLAAGVMQTLVPSSPFLNRLTFASIEGNAYQYNSEASIGGAEFRAVNAGYAESSGTYTSATESLVILGGDVDVDRYLQQTRSNVIDQMAEQAKGKAKAVSYKFNDAFINGDTAVDANAFNGLKKRLTGTQVVSAGTNGIPVLGDGSAGVINTFFDALDQLLAACPSADMLVANDLVLARFRSAARRLTSGGIGFVDGELGKATMLYNGIPVVSAGKKVDGTQVIPQTETQGSSSAASSIYAIHYGDGLNDEGVCGLTNGGVQVDPPRQLETKPALRSRIEWYVGVALFGPQPAARLTGVLAA